jgi:hypothetical protein
MLQVHLPCKRETKLIVQVKAVKDYGLYLMHYDYNMPPTSGKISGYYFT